MSEWDDPVKADRIRVGNMVYASKLEASWALTLDGLGFDAWYEPGRIMLKDGSEWWPDFRVGDVLVEVKPWEGESTDRLWKPYAAADENQLPVLIFRPGVGSPDWDEEKLGADWESCDGTRWISVFGDGEPRFEQYDAEMIYPEGGVRDAASRVLSEPDKTGFAMRHWSEGVRDE